MLTRGRILVALALLLTAGAAALIWSIRPITLARLGAGYGAKQTCSCIFISGRTLESCRGDLDALAQRLVSFDKGSRQITASTLGVSRATARYSPDFGCTLID